MNSIKFNKVVTLTGMIKLILFAFLLGMIYRSSIDFLAFMWAKEDYSYCYLIPFVVAYLLWEKKEALISHESIVSSMGFLPFHRSSAPVKMQDKEKYICQS